METHKESIPPKSIHIEKVKPLNPMDSNEWLPPENRINDKNDAQTAHMILIRSAGWLAG